MRLKRPQPYTVLITRTGEAPIAVTLQPLPLVLTGLILATLPILGILRLMHHNSQLAEENQTLTETANEVLVELETLDSAVQDLQERAGVSETDLSRSPVPRPQGGVGRSATAADLFSLAKARLPQISKRLQEQVQPALETTLVEEETRAAALPTVPPLKGNLEVSSEYGLRRNPFGGSRHEMHSGIDFPGPIGQPVYATGNGIVVLAQFGNGYGNHVVIDHGYGYETLYAHLSRLEVKAGDHVKRGDLIGELGNTGRSSGPHLHYEIHRNGQPINPRNYLPSLPPTTDNSAY